MFIDQPVDDSVSDIDDLYYDLIIINPFSDVSSDSGFLSSSDIVSLKLSHPLVLDWFMLILILVMRE